MKNEIDKTVERIGQLPEENCKRIWINYRTPDGTIYSNYVSFEVADLKAFATAYTKLKADLATAKQGLETIRNMDYRGNRHSSADIAQQTLAAIGKEQGYER